MSYMSVLHLSEVYLPNLGNILFSYFKIIGKESTYLYFLVFFAHFRVIYMLSWHTHV